MAYESSGDIGPLKKLMLWLFVVLTGTVVIPPSEGDNALYIFICI